MSLELSGTTGVKGVAGSVSAPSIVGDDTNTGISFPAADTIKFSTGGVERLSITNSGLSGDGSGLTGISSVGGATGVDFNDDVKARFGTGNDLEIYHDGSNSIINDAGTGKLMMKVGGTTMMQFETNGARMDTGGISFGRALDADHMTFSSPTTSYNGAMNMYVAMQPSINTSYCIRINGHGDYSNSVGSRGILCHNYSTSYESKDIVFTRDTGAEVGKITHGNSSTSYHTSSDYRLKENVVSISDGITRLKTLKPYKFNFKGETRIVDGFFAHEVSGAVPEAIDGEKDAVETTYYSKEDTIPDGKAIGDVKDTASPVYQNIDQSKLVPLLTAALQEAVAKIETLETKVAALEAA